MTTKAIIAAFAGAIVAFFLGWVVFGMLLDPFYAAHSHHYDGLMKNPPNLVGIFLYCLFLSLLLTLVLSKYANVNSFAGGLTVGVRVAFLVSVTIDAMFWAFMHLYDHTALVVDAIVNTLYWTLIAGVIGMVLGMGKKANATA